MVTYGHVPRWKSSGDLCTHDENDKTKFSCRNNEIFMLNEIERKFFVKALPDLDGITALHYERYFLKREKGIEERISQINDSYQYEKKVHLSDLERTREGKEITKKEFDLLKEKASTVIVRDRYNISENPKIAIQIYAGKFKGLIRAEVEFNSSEEAKIFQPLSWMGNEMTGLPIARDSELLDVTEEEFKKYIQV